MLQLRVRARPRRGRRKEGAVCFGAGRVPRGGPGARRAGCCGARSARWPGRGRGSGVWPERVPPHPGRVGSAAPGPPGPPGRCCPSPGAATCHRQRPQREADALFFVFAPTEPLPLTKVTSGALTERTPPGSCLRRGPATFPGHSAQRRPRGSTAHRPRGPRLPGLAASF